MVAIVTEKFRLHNAAQFKESFSEASASTYYMLIGKPTAFDSDTSGGTDTSPPTPNDDVSSEFHVWDSAIGAKKISSGDVSNVVSKKKTGLMVQFMICMSMILARPILANPAHQICMTQHFSL